MIVSEVTTDYLAEYLRIADPDEKDERMLEQMLTSAKVFCRSYMGRDDLDAHEDIVHAVLVLVQDMYDNRTLYVPNSRLNYVVEGILNRYSVNLLPDEVIPNE